MVDLLSRFGVIRSMKRKTRYYILPWLYALLSVVLPVLQCQSSQEFLKRQPPDANFATVHAGEAVYSTTDFKFENDRQRLVYKYWKFEKSDGKSVSLLYEEHFDYLKLKPDFSEAKSYEVDKNFMIKIQGMGLEIFALRKDSMVYYMKSGVE